MKKGYIYSLICPLSNETRYIGKTVNRLEYRLYKHFKDINKSESYKNNWLKQLNSLNILHKLRIELIEEVNIEKLNEREIYWIKFFKDAGYNLTNSTIGGDGTCGYKHSTEAKLKISNRSKLPRSKISDIGKHNISMSLIGNKRRLGKKHNEDAKYKISLKNKGKKPANIRAVIQYDLCGNFIKKWESITEVEKKLGYKNISSACSGRRRSAHKFIWKYEE